MKLTEAETLIKQWRECKDRMVAVNNLANSCGKVVVRNSGTTELELTPLETKMLMNILNNTIYEREQHLRERIVNELHIDVEV